MAKRVSVDDFAALAIKEFDTLELRRKQIFHIRDKYDIQVPGAAWSNKVATGLFRVDGDPANADVSDYVVAAPAPTPSPVAPNAGSVTDNLAVENYNGIKVFSTPLDHSLVPEKDKDFVAWGNYHLIKKLLSSNHFLSIYVTGETGNGKTFNFEQAAAALKREIITVNFTAQTDEDDLIGGFRLVAGDTVWVDGPVLEAMKRGAILLLDEVDNGTEPLMTLQPVLQGKPYFVKKLGRLVTPAPGFAVVATANTKGDGDGDYAFTNVLNKAFLDRFKITVEQPYPSVAVERKILEKYVANNFPSIDKSWIDTVTKFVDVVRNTYQEGGISEQISTRRLVDMTQMYGLLGNAKEVVKLTTNRFDPSTQEAMLTLWENIDATPDPDVSNDEDLKTVEEEPLTPTVAPPAPSAPAPSAPAPSKPAVAPAAPSAPSTGSKFDRIPF